MTLFYRDTTLSGDVRKKGIEQFLKTIGGRSGVRFLFTGSPSTDGRTVWLGNVVPDDETFEIHALGHGIHEMMHITDTDVALINEASQETPFVFALFNSFEDLRIDRLGASRYAGYKLWREELWRTKMKAGKLAAAAPARLAPGIAFVLWLHCTVLADEGYAWAAKCLPALEEKVRSLLPEVLMALFRAEAMKTHSINSTHEALDHARRFARLCRELIAQAVQASKEEEARGGSAQKSAMNAPQSTSEEAGGGAGCAQEPTGGKESSKASRRPGGNPAGKMQQASGSRQKTDGKQSSQEASQHESSTQRGRKTNDKADGDPKQTAQLLQEIMREDRFESEIPTMFSQQTHQMAASAGSGAAGFTNDDGAVPTAKLWPAPSHPTQLRSNSLEYQQAFEEALGHTAQLTRQFAQLLRTEDENEDRRSTEGLELAPDWLNQVASNDQRLFTAAGVERNVSADVTILLDRSGSMGIKTMTTAKGIVAALIGALRAVRGCTVRAAVFPGPGQDDKVSLVALDNETAAESFKRLAPVSAYGSTPIAAAMRWAETSFNRTARDKLLIVITDGRFPTGFGSTAQDALDALGIEFALLSIDVANQDIARNMVHVIDVKDIEPAMQKLLAATRFCRTMQSGS